MRMRRATQINRIDAVQSDHGFDPPYKKVAALLGANFVFGKFRLD
jgi:hypothetical protein